MLKRIAIIGGGWSGLTAAYKLSKLYKQIPNINCYEVHLFESSNALGGRARAFQHKNYTLDNGQHILVGAYHNTLNILYEIGKAQDSNFELSNILDIYNIQWHVQDSFSLCDINILKDIPYLNKLNTNLNFKLFFSILFSNMQTKFKLELIYLMLKLKLINYSLANYPHIKTVEDWYKNNNISNFLQINFFTPLCLSALNTNVENACIKKFLNAIKLTIGSGNIDKAKLIIPKQDLSILFSTPIIEYLFKKNLANNNNNFNLHISTAINNISKSYTNINEGDFSWVLNQNYEDKYDILILATPYNTTQKLLRDIDINLPDIEHMPITTIYVETSATLAVNIPFLIYKDDVIFQKSKNKSKNIWAIVCSAKYINDNDVLVKLTDYESKFKHKFILIKRICEKRATYKCTPNHPNISNNPYKNLYLCGDYLHTYYPATLEAAVDSAIDIVDLVSKN